MAANGFTTNLNEIEKMIRAVEMEDRGAKVLTIYIVIGGFYISNLRTTAFESVVCVILEARVAFEPSHVTIRHHSKQLQIRRHYNSTSSIRTCNGMTAIK